MKFRMIGTALIFFSLILFPCIAGAAWQAEILAEGEDLDVPNKSSVTIGVQNEAETTPSPPSPPSYSCNLRIAPADWSDYLATDIRKEGEKTYCWILAVNPHGNAGSPVSRTATVSWNPADFGEGEYVLREGYECSGTAVVADMKNLSSYTVTGDDSDQFFSLIFTIPENSTNNVPASPDSDQDGIPDNSDTDDDNDGVPDAEDAFPLDSKEQKDTDNDGTGDNADTDDDNDGVPDTEDAFPLDSKEQKDTDNDGTGDNADTDDDNDGMPDEWEIRYGLNPLQNDADADADGDGLSNLEEYQQGTDPLSAAVISPQPEPDPAPNSPPAQPLLLSPADNESDVVLTPLLQTGAFSDPDTGDSHGETRWQISETADFSETLLDIGDTESLTELQMEEGELAEDTQYFWRVLFIDNQQGASEWSEPFRFRTMANGEPETPEPENPDSPTETPEPPSDPEGEVTDTDQAGEPGDNQDTDASEENQTSDGGGGGGCFISVLLF
ncbi:MAG: hypothetical protein V2I97_19380 [Desulfococcaceae bacterium]|jgi:hypothetical protein|nr:hypothetical protein [Desulfococcaceae bacterium]